MNITLKNYQNITYLIFDSVTDDDVDEIGATLLKTAATRNIDMKLGLENSICTKAINLSTEEMGFTNTIRIINCDLSINIGYTDGVNVILQDSTLRHISGANFISMNGNSHLDYKAVTCDERIKFIVRSQHSALRLYLQAASDFTATVEAEYRNPDVINSDMSLFRAKHLLMIKDLKAFATLGG